MLMDHKCDFGEHMQEISNSSYRDLGFFLRNAKDFKDFATHTTLFTTLVRWHLDLAAVVWVPELQNQVKQL